MDALRLRKKFPEVTQDEMFDLISRFKYVLEPSLVANAISQAS